MKTKKAKLGLKQKSFKMFGVLFKESIILGIQLYKKSITKAKSFFRNRERWQTISEYAVYSNTRSSRHHQSIFNFKFSSRKSQGQWKLAKEIIYFITHFCSKASLILGFSTHSKLKKYTPATQPKTFLTLQIFQQTSVVW